MAIYVESYGRDCLGNISGYRVAEYGPRGYFKVHGIFAGDIYERGSFEKAKERAEDLLGYLTTRCGLQHD